ncbi:MAG: histidine triad nucleotide-binding protein [Candidatus Omnitrophica bacterium]|nr:histidine triad nucleotide-binding protein [Candidatus Omnitrophota bacterium]
MNLNKDCLFCKIIRGEIPCKKVYEDENTFAFRDINPQAPIHIIVVPKAHIERISDVTSQNAKIISDMVMAANSIARQNNIDKSGYRLVINCNDDGGQTVYHIHVHLLGGRRMHWPPG